MGRNTILFSLGFLFCIHCFAQQYPFIHYTPKDGLVNNRARFIFQDNKGILYISTFGGLSVYDGSRFTNYTTDNGLATNTINDILEMGDDSLWIIPNMAGLQCMVKGKIKNINTTDGFYPVVNKMIRCSNGSYYAVADEGLFHFEKNIFRKINLVDKNNKDAGQFFTSGAEIKNKFFILTDPHVQAIGGPSRLIVYDPKKNKTLVDTSLLFFSAVESPQGDILISTNKGIKKIDESSLQENKIRFTELPLTYHLLEKYTATEMYFDKQKNLWLCISGGVIKIDTTGDLKLFAVENGLPVNNQLSVFQDKENIMWFVNEQTGISKLTNQHFQYYSQIKPGFYTNDIYTNNLTDSVWFLNSNTNGLILQYKEKSKEFQLPAKFSFPPVRLISMQGDKNYIADLFSLYQCDLKNEKDIHLTKLYTGDTTNSNLVLTCIMPDGHGNVIASSDKLLVITQNKKVISYPLGYFSDGFAIAPDNYLWITTRAKKLFLFRLHPDDPDHYLQLLHTYDKQLPEMSARSLAVDKKGNVWIGTRDRGLFCLFFDGLSLRSWKQVTTKDGLSDNFIAYLHVDESNNVWACSRAGLDKIQLKDEKIFVENITGSNNIYQHIEKIITTRQGMRWIETEAGVIKITPSESIRNNFQPKIIFRELNENGNRIDLLAAPVSFSYKENNINFSVAAPSFIDEKEIRYSYLLEGNGNKLWSDPSPQATINFIGLSPGKYTLKAKAIFVNRQYPESEIAYSFSIRPPWWQTWWIRFGLAFFAIMISGIIIRNYYQRKLRRQQMALEKQQAVEKERTRIATDMHDDLGAGLSTIRFLSEKVKRNTFSQVTKDDVEKMQNTSNELIDKMNEIIWSMNEKNDSLENLIFYTRSYAMEYCEENNLVCSIQLSETIPAFFVTGEIRRNIFLTVKESLHNIVKHACAKNVDIVIDVSGDLDINIHDDGIGLHENQKKSGGNGFRNMRKRIELIGGTINIQNDTGTTIVLKIPLDSSTNL